MVEIIKRLEEIKSAFPELEVKIHKIIEEGLINEIHIINEELVFRFPRNNTWAKGILINELNVVRLIEPYIEIPIPKYKSHNNEFVSYQYLPGKSLLKNDILELEENEQEQIIKQLGEFLYQIHNIPMEEITKYQILQSDVNRNYDVWIKLYENVKKELFPYMWSYSKEWVERHFEPIINDREFMEYKPSLIDGDIAPYHILYDKNTKSICGKIDFGTAGIGDPAADVACILYQYGESILGRMRKYYPGLEQYIDRARFWAGTLELQWALIGKRNNDLSWLMVHLGTSRDVMPIGNKFKL